MHEQTSQLFLITYLCRPMKSTVNNSVLKLITYFMIGVMGVFIVNKIVFTHVHQLDDGTIVKHAHPYNKANDATPYKTHHHSNADLVFFQNLSTLFLVAFFVLGLVLFVRKEKVNFRLAVEHALVYISLHKGRAPPILS